MYKTVLYHADLPPMDGRTTGEVFEVESKEAIGAFVKKMAEKGWTNRFVKFKDVEEKSYDIAVDLAKTKDQGLSHASWMRAMKMNEKDRAKTKEQYNGILEKIVKHYGDDIEKVQHAWVINDG